MPRDALRTREDSHVLRKTDGPSRSHSLDGRGRCNEGPGAGGARGSTHGLARLGPVLVPGEEGEHGIMWYEARYRFAN